MKQNRYQSLLYLICTVIIITLGIQIYWNYKNYQESKRQLKRDLQTALDQSVEDYFTVRARNNTISFISNQEEGFDTMIDVFKVIKLDSLNNNDELIIDDSLEIKGVSVYKGVNINDSIAKNKLNNKSRFPDVVENKDTTAYKLKIGNWIENPNQNITAIEALSNRIVLSLKSDKVYIHKLDSIFQSQLETKEIAIDYQLKYKTADSIQVSNNHTIKGDSLFPQSELIKEKNQLTLHYSGTSATVLKRNLTGILLSTLLISCVIACLFYLLDIIKRQKALNDIKNDLISNITHEFKTPIATTSAALEGIKNFTSSGDKEKTNRYLSMGNDQLDKLNSMVEKLLETATLDSEELSLQKNETDISATINSLIHKFKPQTDKAITFNNTSKRSHIIADEFHLENAINNLIDNAIKYGGDTIDINFYNEHDLFIIEINDNGNSLQKVNTKHLFDKFYRITNGNKHDVKGFGIGLYYTKSIIEKHNGSITLKTEPQTSFKITLPYE